MTKNSIQVKQVLMSILTAVVFTFGFSSCSDDSDITSESAALTNQPAQQLAEYAVLIYGHGSVSNSLDVDISKNIHDCYVADPACLEKVKVAVQYKWANPKSLKYAYAVEHLMNDLEFLTDEEKAFAKEKGSKAVRFVVDPKLKGESPQKGKVYLGTKQMREAPQFGETGFDMSTPDSLTNFINWAVKAIPAKHYMLVISSHGGGYSPHSDTNFRPTTDKDNTTRALMPDTDTEKQMSAYELRAALQNADKKMDVVFFDACLMNMMEVEYEIRDLTNYIIAATFPVPASGGNFRYLINELATAKSTDIALGNFVKATTDSWTQFYNEHNIEGNYDLTAIRTQPLGNYAAKVKDFTDRLVNAYTRGGDDIRKKIDVCTANAIKVEDACPFYDFDCYAALITTALPEYYPNGYFEELKHAYNECLIRRYSSPGLEKHGFKIGVSCILAKEGSYDLHVWQRSNDGVWTIKKKVTPQVDIADTYQHLEWDRATGWSRWLLLNKQTPNTFCHIRPDYKATDTIKY